MSVLSRLKQWSELQKVRPAEELADVSGGRDGELLLQQLVGSSFEFKDARLLTGRRIPSKSQGRRREIDLIVCTPRRIHLIEVKNWSGRLEVGVGGRGSWRQTRRGGEVVDHGDLLETNQLKLEAVVEYLRGRGLELDEASLRGCLTPQIIFTNPNLQMEPEIEARPDVISRRELDGYLGRQTETRRRDRTDSVFSSLIELCLDWESKRASRRLHAASAPSPSIPPPQYRRIVSWLEEAGTWDQLQFYGGRSVTGDVVSLRVAGTTYRSTELREMAGSQPIRLRWTRNRSWGLFKAVTGLGSPGTLTLGKTRLSLSPTDTLLFHAVGDRESTNRKLAEIDQVILGY